ncbi:hypothetical protein GCM10008967_03950 [Bacillus carboniphilus]|uniref:Transcriptional regulator n=1 Tax=Bacillus carboniphilus TaxID=86663 RepID=A0ABN0VTJ7_9BACI
MKIHIGVVGPEDSVEQILKGGEPFSELELISFIYQKTEETEDIINENKEGVHHWFFSGPLPYYYALSKGVIKEEEGSYTPLHGSSMLGTLLEAFVKEGRILTRISIDTIQTKEVEKAKASFSLQDVMIYSYTHPYSEYVPSEEVLDFHKGLYKAGKVEAVITCVNSVFVALKEEGIPVYRVVPSELAVHRAYGLIKERAQSSVYRKSQLVMIGVEVIASVRSARDHQTSFKLKHQLLELKRVLLDFVEEVNGSIVEVGDGLFYIYTTLGEVELFIKEKPYSTVIEECYVNSQLPIRMGVGYGSTVLEAEEHVRISLEHARTEREAVVIITDENKEIKKILDEKREVSFVMRNKGGEWEKKFKDASISSSQVAKIVSLSHHYHQGELTSHNLARWLKGTERNARRILAELERIGLAKVIGEESVGRGRPRKIYELTLDR